ncbi:RNA-binding transcriptional accessory protein [Alicyclobacillus curvatus]|nr:RNA-binding transcriptional accessory protein [Alicyclobacillus curvatus]
MTDSSTQGSQWSTYVPLAPDYDKILAARLQLKSTQVRAAIRLLDEGNTIPFIARYRKEMTGELDEEQLRKIQASYEQEQGLYQRKSDVVRLLAEHGAFTDEAQAESLVKAVISATTLTEVDDIYRPYRPKRRTRAMIAKERGLEGLAEWLMAQAHARASQEETHRVAAEYVNVEGGVETPLEALAGAMDIFAEIVADDANTRKFIRQTTVRAGTIRSTAVDEAAESVYEMYYDYEESLGKLPPHRVLAMNRGERDGFLKVALRAPEDKILSYLVDTHVRGNTRRKAGPEVAGSASATHKDLSYVGQLLADAVVDAYKRLIAPAIEREIRAEFTDRAEEQAVQVFGENLRNLLMQRPLEGRVVLGVDPAYRTGCKLAVVDDTGKLLEVKVIYPTPPQNKVTESKKVIHDLLARYKVGLITIGNGTASRETEAFIADCGREYMEQTGLTVPYLIVSEAGASVYSASELAKEEFPHLDVSERSAISIARRVQDPLAELVKIDPKSVGVGQYQHDVSQKRLDDTLTGVVETAVNQVGADVNTASASLLSYVAGLNKTVAKNIVSYRDENGRFSNRKQLARVPRLGPKTLEQCVGFLRIHGGDVVLDNTPIHPESYPVVHKLLERTGTDASDLRDGDKRTMWLDGVRAASIETLSAEIGVGIPTLRDILGALERPGRDPREDVPPPILRTDVLKLEDLEEGMVLTGTVRNVVDFGAFVDVGLKNDGLVHISQLADKFVRRPMDVVAVGDIVQVRVIQVDAEKQRLGLSMKGHSGQTGYRAHD